MKTSRKYLYKAVTDGRGNFNTQYPALEVKYTRAFHDRFLILDRETAYHVGPSLKDAGKKCFGINLIQDVGIIRDIMQRLELEAEEKFILKKGVDSDIMS